MLGRPPARLHPEPTADGLTKAVGGPSQDDRSFGPPESHRGLSQPIQVEGHPGQISQLHGDVEAFPQLALGLLVAALEHGGEGQGTQDLALVPPLSQGAGPGKTLLAVGAGAVEVPGNSRIICEVAKPKPIASSSGCSAMMAWNCS
jgi:hypothetical protein